MSGPVVAVLQARVSSTRLPGKVLMPILGRPMLALQMERIRRARTLDRLVVATSDRTDDNAIDALCRDEAVPCFRGSLDDVLDRFWRAASAHGAETVVRLTGDCPLSDPAIIDAAVTLHRTGGYDYTSNATRRTYPDGLDVEVARMAALEQAWREAREPFQREHVTPFLSGQPRRFRIGELVSSPDLSQLRLTVDYAEDFELVRTIYEALYPSDPAFTTDAVLALLDRRPDIAAINARHAPAPSPSHG